MLSKDALGLIDGEVMGELFKVFPNGLAANQIALNLKRDNEFIRKRLLFFETKHWVKKLPSVSGDLPTKRFTFALTKEMYAKYAAARSKR